MPQLLLRYGKAIAICTLLICIIATKVSSQIITTVAGNGTAGYNGDSLVATKAELYSPTFLAIDTAGNIYISDFRNNRVRKIDANGMISNFAGNGKYGYSGDGGAATSAQLNQPTGIVSDKSGNLYIVDEMNAVIRKVDNKGIISTVAGNGTAGFAGDGGPATSAEFKDPWGITIDASGNLYIADEYNNRIRKIDTKGNISTVAGNGTAGYNGDSIAATSAELYYPEGVAVDASGNIYIADQYNNRIRKVDTKGIISTIAGNGTSGLSGDGGPATLSYLNNPFAVTIDAFGNIYISDFNNNRIRKIDVNGIINNSVGNGTFGFSGDGGTATSAELKYPCGMVFDALGNLYFADVTNERIRKVSGIVTPVTLTSFTATKQDNNVLLNWQTATEINTAYFNIQRSTNGKDFATVGSVNAKGADSYTSLTPIPSPKERETVYYRLEIVDKDGSKTYSEIRTITNYESGITISPNPAKDVVYISGKGMMHISVMDNTGKIVIHKTLDTVDNTSINIANLSKGVYYISVKDNNGKVQSGKMVVE